MAALSYFHHLYRYHNWANRTLFDQLTGLDPVPPEGLRVFAHIVGADALWLSRLHGDPPGMPVWPEASAAEVGAALDQTAASWRRLLDAQRLEKLLRPIAYVNSRGTPWANRVHEILTHVALHAAHHRGQVCTVIRAAGITPVLIDYAHAVRSGQLDDHGTDPLADLAEGSPAS